jgi:hypothetical protein
LTPSIYHQIGLIFDDEDYCQILKGIHVYSGVPMSNTWMSLSV